MDQEAYERGRVILLGLQRPTLRSDLVFDEPLVRAGSDPDEDVRTAALYMVDVLMEREEERATGIVTRWAETGGVIGGRSCARFLAHSRFRDISGRVRELRSQIEGRLRSIVDDETRRLVESFSRQPRPPADPPPVAKMLIVVHGTWASGETWWRWPSPFTQYLDGLTGGSVYKGPDPFSWSGGNSDQDRQAGASALVAWVQAHPAGALSIVSHSHGGNVVLLATRRGMAAHRAVLLGSPMRTDYTPDVRRVELTYNVYSFGDLVQTPAGTFPHERGEGRTLADSERVVNFLAHNGLFGPGHSDLHDQAVWQANGFDQLVT